MPPRLHLPRWSTVLTHLYDNESYAQRLNRKLKGSLTHLRELVIVLERHHLILATPSNKIKRVRLTTKGERVANAIFLIRHELNHSDEQITLSQEDTDPERATTS